jgi:hypothetical protein
MTLWTVQNVINGGCRQRREAASASLSPRPAMTQSPGALSILHESDLQSHTLKQKAAGVFIFHDPQLEIYQICDLIYLLQNKAHKSNTCALQVQEAAVPCLQFSQLTDLVLITNVGMTGAQR